MKKRNSNLIGVSGKIGSGKDTVGKIIQYLTLGEEFSKTNGDILADLEYNGYCANKSTFKIKKFADKLKDIVCILIGCTREQLEDREFKEKPLGEEWWYYSTRAFQNGVPVGSMYSSLDEFPFHSSKAIETKLTPRRILQLLGTEAGREILHPNIWVNALFSDYKETKKYYPNNKKGLEKEAYAYKEKPNWVITDMRFPNELKAVKDKGGITIRVNRDWRLSALTQLENNDDTELLDNQLNKLSEHESETALDDAEFDYIINNNGTIEELIEKVKEILTKEKII